VFLGILISALGAFIIGISGIPTEKQAVESWSPRTLQKEEYEEKKKNPSVQEVLRQRKYIAVGLAITIIGNSILAYSALSS